MRPGVGMSYTFCVTAIAHIIFFSYISFVYFGLLSDISVMGKRKHHDEEDYLALKMRKLEKKLARVRRKQRRYYGSSSDFEQNQYSDSDHYPDYPAELLQEAPQNEGAPYEVNIPSDSTSHPKPADEPTPAPTTTLASAPERACAVVPEATSTPTPADAPPTEHASTESIQELEPDILCLLGEEPAREEKFGENVHKDIANRWTDILVNGLKDEVKKDILKIYSVPYNLKIAQAPTLNPEIRAAVNDGALKRDNILAEKQKVLSSIITCVANTITAILQTGSCDEEIKCQTLKSLSDAGRLLCHTHYSETQTRRNFLLSCLNKEIKDSVKDLKRDHLLFGNDLQDNLKSMKAIIRTGTELKPTAAKPKLPPKNIQPKEHTSRALNWRGPPPPQSQPRRMPPRQTATAGGRKQPQTRRGTDRRVPRQYNQTPRR